LDLSLMTSAKEPVVEPAPPAPVIAEPEPAVEESTEEASSGHAAYSAEPLLSSAAEEVLQQETANVVAEELPALQASPAAEKSAASEPASVPAPNMDDIVAKVLAKMSPDALQAVTREILRPLVEAMIKDELSKK
jgi:hypothetical protein